MDFWGLVAYKSKLWSLRVFDSSSFVIVIWKWSIAEWTLSQSVYVGADDCVSGSGLFIHSCIARIGCGWASFMWRPSCSLYCRSNTCNHWWHIWGHNFILCYHLCSGKKSVKRSCCWGFNSWLGCWNLCDGFENLWLFYFLESEHIVMCAD